MAELLPTGYLVDTMGADYLIEIYGSEHRILSSNYYEYDINYRTEETRGQHDWNAWSPMFEVDSAVKGNKLETQLWVDEINVPAGVEPRALIQITDPRGNQDISPIFSRSGALVTGLISTVNGNLDPSETTHLLTLTLTNHGQEPVLVESIVFSQHSTAVESDLRKAVLTVDGLTFQGSFDGKKLRFSNIDLLVDSFKHVDLEVTLAEDAEAGHALSLELSHVGTIAGVTYSAERVVAYISGAPIMPVIDGLFDEWTDPYTDEIGDVDNQNVDISAYDVEGYLEETYFYLQVEGNMLYGNAVPSTKAMNIPSSGDGDSAGPGDHEPSQSSGTQEETPLPVETGEDAVYIFLDTVPEQGYENSNLPFGADHMSEIKGIGGEITTARYYRFDGENSNDWSWKFVKSVAAASGSQEIETVVDVSPLSVHFHVVAWNGEDEDWGGELWLLAPESGGSRYVGQGDGGATRGYWRFNTGSGTSATDSSGQDPANTGTLINMEVPGDWVSAKFGYGLNFDGTNEYVGVGSDASLDVTGEMTIEMWANPTGFHSSWNYLMIYGNTKVEFGFYGTDAKPRFKVKPASGDTLEVAGNALSTGQWYHIVGVRSGSLLRIYVNGVLIRTTTGFSTGNLASGDSLQIGGKSGSTASFNGKIDEVRILNYAKTAFGGGVVIDEMDFDGGGSNYIKLHNNAGSTVDIRGWRFYNEDSSTTPIISITSSTTITAGGTLTLSQSSYSSLANLDSSDFIEAYDFDSNNDGSDENSRSYQAMVDFVAWGASPAAGDANAVSAGLWTDNTYVSVSGGDPGVMLSSSGNNDEAVSDWEAIPEFSDAVLPVVSVSALFVIFRKRKQKEE